MRLWISTFVFLISFQILAQANLSDTFKAGVDGYAKGQFKEAAASFREILKAEPRNPDALYNLALAESQLGHHALAIGLLRRTLAIEPRMALASRGLRTVGQRLPVPEVAEPGSFYEILRFYILRPAPLWAFFFVFIFSTFIAIWFLLNWKGEKIRHKLDEEVVIHLPVTTWIFVGLAGLFSILLLVKIYDLQVSRATVIRPKVEVRSGPEADAPGLFELQEGSEIIVVRREGNWVQIRQPGSYSGWVLKSKLLFY